MARARLALRIALTSLAVVLVLLPGCDPNQAPPPSGFCPQTCAEGLRCYAPTRECVTTTATSCDRACEAWEQCSARAVVPTCYAQVCSLPPAPVTPLLKVVSLEILSDDEACDLDDDGVGDGQLHRLQAAYTALPQVLADSVAADRVTMFLSLEGERVDIVFGTLAPESLRCDPSNPEANCRYTISRESYDRGARLGPCPTWLSMSGAMLSGSSIVAGGATTNTGISVPIGEQHFLLQTYGARLDGELSVEDTQPESSTVRLCGAVPQAELLEALAGLPADTLEPVGGLANAQRLLATVLRPDIDADSDGTRDSVSFAFRFRAVRAETTGWSPLVPATAN